MTLNLKVPEPTELKPKITVIGVGGAGGNAVNNMIRSELEGVDFAVANTDAQALALSLTDNRIQIGRNITQGLGAGAKPEIGRASAEESLDQIVEHISGSHMCFITAGMGGGTGTGAAPVVARIAKEHGILTVGVVTKPFQFEGAHRMRLAEAGIEDLQQYVDTLIIIPNQNLFRIANERTTFAEAFTMADEVLHSGVRGITDLMVMPGLINLDFADVRSVMSEMGKAMMGTGEAEGDRRALDAAEAAISNPLLDDVSMKGARGVLINITGGMDMTLFEVDEAANRIRSEVDPDANIIVGSTFSDTLNGRIRVSVVATGIDIDEDYVAPVHRPAATITPRVETQAAPAPAAVAAAAPAAAEVAEDEGEDLGVEVEEAFIAPAPASVQKPAPSPAPAARVQQAEPALAADPSMAERGHGDEEEASPFVKRSLSLLERMAGSLARRDDEERAEAPDVPEKRLRVAAADDASAPRQEPRARQEDRLFPAVEEDDQLEIPAFLRRQAN
ncbi:MAG: cell division protein FtsZ [Alphaproteobacteria bacterium]|nr:cell division protein FtsZ [Alphaproteobacteria bacterium]MDX5369050.1 cell division protein FtsZ [Alphaproteobacteria bacterium]MDX5463754.1 cell division protein FtsZ [Alphaproteobacteria bacterium]